MIRDKANSRTCPGNAETMLWQCLMHRSVSPAGRGPCADSIRVWIDPPNLMGKEQYWETILQALALAHCFPSLSNERFVLMLADVCVNDNVLWRHLDTAPTALDQASPTPTQSSLNLCKPTSGECADHQHWSAPGNIWGELTAGAELQNSHSSLALKGTSVSIFCRKETPVESSFL